MSKIATATAHSARTGGLLTSHWRGVRPLPQSFWLGFALPWLMTTLTLGAAATWMQVSGAWLRGTSVALLLGWPLATLFVLWGAVGAWRSASLRTTQGARSHRAWGWLAQAAVATGLLAMAAELVLKVSPQAGTYLALALGEDPIGRVSATASPDGHRLRLAGPLGSGDAPRVLRRLDELPELRLLELDMAGGRVAEVQRVAEAVAARGLQTRVVGVCNNACVLVFLAGTGRQVMPDGRIGFHRLAPPVSINPLFELLARREQAALYRAAGLPKIFTIKLLATPPDRLWQPELDELASAGLVGVPGRPLDIALPGPAGTPIAEYVKALSTHWLWQALDARYSGAILAAAGRMAAARDAGAADDSTQVAGQRVVELLLPRLLAEAGPGLWEPFATLLADQLAAAAPMGTQVCLGVLAGDADARRSLPEPLQQREGEWLASALSGPASAGPLRKPNALEREVMSRALGERAMGLLAGLLGPTRRGLGCTQATALLSAVSALPPAERHLAQRFMFGPK